MKNLLIPCDFSAPAINGYRLGLDLVARSQGTLHVLHVMELPVIHESVLSPVMAFEQQLFKELREKAEKEFAKVQAKYSNPKAKVVFNVAFGPVARMVVDYSLDHNIEAIVMGSHGVAGGMRALFVGSNAEKIVRHAPVPVIVVKNYSKRVIRNIVFPNTLETDRQEELVMKVKALQDFFDAMLHIVYINTPLNFRPDRENYERLEAFAKRFMLKNCTLNVYNDRDEEEGILGFTHRIKADLIAMSTHGRRGLSRVINGSVAEDIVNHSDIPVWTMSLQTVPVEG